MRFFFSPTKIAAILTLQVIHILASLKPDFRDNAQAIFGDVPHVNGIPWVHLNSRLTSRFTQSLFSFLPLLKRFCKAKIGEACNEMCVNYSKENNPLHGFDFLGIIRERREKSVFSWIVSRLTQISRGFEKSKTNVQRKRHRSLWKLSPVWDPRACL